MTRLAWTLLGALLLAGCPRHGELVPTHVLAADSQALGVAFRRANVERPQLLLEAYLAHFRWQHKSRDQALCHWLRVTGQTVNQAVARLSLVQPPSPERMRSFLAMLIDRRTCPKAPRPPARQAFKPGLFSFSETKTALSGDTLAVQERWIIRRHGARIRGFYLRRLERRSGNARPYGCNKRPHYTALMAFTFEGRTSGKEFSLEETDAYVRPGPCAPRSVQLDRCKGTLVATNLVLSCPGRRILTRTADLPGSQGAKTALYRWSQTSPRAGGGQQQVDEHWHLARFSGQLFGFYTRATTAEAQRGQVHRCNGKPRYALKRLFLLQGTIQGEKVTLHEVAALHRPHKCDDAKVRLDRYTGTLTAARLRLSWGQGTQELKRLKTTTSLAQPLGAWFPRPKKQ